VNQKSRSSAKPNVGQFPKGRSGNPSGRPKTTRARQASTFDIVVEKTLAVSLPSGGTREITLEEALQQQTFQKALKGDRKAQREVQSRMCSFPASGSSWKNFAREGVAMDNPGCRQRVTF